MTVSGCVFECVFACVRVEATATAVRMDVAEERVWTLLFFLCDCRYRYGVCGLWMGILLCFLLLLKWNTGVLPPVPPCDE